MSKSNLIPELLVGCDFSSSPSKRKPIVMASGTASNGRVLLSGLERLDSLQEFDNWLCQDRHWLGAFDFPFGLPRELVMHMGWPTQWLESINHYASLSRLEIRNTFAAFCDARPIGKKFAHRATDLPSGASPSMKWVNPPVAFMLHAGTPRLVAASVHIPGLHPGDIGRIALEGYPGLLAREALGHRSYKSDDRIKQTPERLIARKDLITALEHGQTRLGLRLKVSHAQRDALVDDGSGDNLDAVLCLMQAAWAARQGAPLYGLPADMDTLEGWIVTA
ncbi:MULTISPECIES: DUF429 domain-containing protein [unclassified Polaromonas]|uniref:DUF429 domain-containing protein n=1 Tax=unclassified Polaromonas TaxID=2638319 RepID=UPI0018CAF48F|nr:MULTISPECIES: DUF429 domain-containing protein [unclassified Polaromonas]MBG6070272.1 hypothetical protein [Polaromonas sp. CG_9.7]MBG6112270.1 hypothetical protein [Polaromonas sp. CG_9.2]MDH6183915.1 hypothetical protein [Polaromonas sp. CG_23.6]